MARSRWRRSLYHRIMESGFYGGSSVGYGLHHYLEHEGGHLSAQTDLTGGMSESEAMELNC